MTSQLMLPTTAIAMSRLLPTGKASSHALEEPIAIKLDHQPVRSIRIAVPKRAPLGRTRARHDAEDAALDVKQLGPEEEPDDAGIVNGSGVAADSGLGQKGCDELCGSRVAFGKRRGEVAAGPAGPGDVERDGRHRCRAGQNRGRRPRVDPDIELGFRGGVSASDGPAHDYEIGNLLAKTGAVEKEAGEVAERPDGDDGGLLSGLPVEP